MITFGIDPGPTESSFVLLEDNGCKILDQGDCQNVEMLVTIAMLISRLTQGPLVACEMIQHYGSGMAVGKEVFDTCRWIGRYEQLCSSLQIPFTLVFCPHIKQVLCGSVKANDANVRQALIDRLGPPWIESNEDMITRTGQIKQKRVRSPGPTHNVAGHRWSALAVAVVYQLDKGD